MSWCMRGGTSWSSSAATDSRASKPIAGDRCAGRASTSRRPWGTRSPVPAGLEAPQSYAVAELITTLQGDSAHITSPRSRLRFRGCRARLLLCMRSASAPTGVRCRNGQAPGAPTAALRSLLTWLRLRSGSADRLKGALPRGRASPPQRQRLTNAGIAEPPMPIGGCSTSSPHSASRPAAPRRRWAAPRRRWC